MLQGKEFPFIYDRASPLIGHYPYLDFDAIAKIPHLPLSYKKISRVTAIVSFKWPLFIIRPRQKQLHGRPRVAEALAEALATEFSFNEGQVKKNKTWDG